MQPLATAYQNCVPVTLYVDEERRTFKLELNPPWLPVTLVVPEVDHPVQSTRVDYPRYRGQRRLTI
jgi:hypothetical protein